MTFQDSNFGTALELAVRFGKTLVVQEIDFIEPILYPLLRKDLISMGESLVFFCPFRVTLLLARVASHPLNEH